MKTKFKRRQLFKTIIQIAQEMFLTLSSDLKKFIQLQLNLLAYGNFLLCPCSVLSFEISTFHELTEDCHFLRSACNGLTLLFNWSPIEAKIRPISLVLASWLVADGGLLFFSSFDPDGFLLAFSISTACFT